MGKTDEKSFKLISKMIIDSNIVHLDKNKDGGDMDPADQHISSNPQNDKNRPSGGQRRWFEKPNTENFTSTEQTRELTRMTVDFGTTTTFVKFMSHGRMVNPFDSHDDKAFCPSVVFVSRNGIDVLPQPYRDKPGKVRIRNAKRLLGKSREDLTDDMLKEELYGANVCFDEKNRPYFHCEFSDKEGKVVRDVYPEDVFYVILKFVKEKVRIRSDMYVTTCCFTIPHYTTNRARRLMRKMASDLDIRCEFMMKEPTAAGIPFLLPKENETDQRVDEGKNVFVFDWGGSTLDISVIRRNGDMYKVITTGGNPTLGGNNIDQRIAEYAYDWYQRQTGRPLLSGSEKKRIKDKQKLLMHCCEGKESLSSAEMVEITLEDIGDVEDNGGVDNSTIELTRTSFEKDIMMSILRKCKECCEKTLQDAKLKKQDIDYVLLVGGSSCIPAVKTIFSDWNIPFLTLSLPQDAVVAGAMAAFEHSMIANNIKESFDSNIGYFYINRQKQSVFNPILRKGLKIGRKGIETHYSNQLKANEGQNIKFYRVIDENNEKPNYHQEAELVVGNLDHVQMKDPYIPIRLSFLAELDGDVTIRLTTSDENDKTILGSVYFNIDD